MLACVGTVNRIADAIEIRPLPETGVPADEPPGRYIVVSGTHHRQQVVVIVAVTPLAVVCVRVRAGAGCADLLPERIVIDGAGDRLAGVGDCALAALPVK